MCDDTRLCVLLLTAQTLVVMDSIWQEKSLDLNLVPYGCIATGHNIGTHDAGPSHTHWTRVPCTSGGPGVPPWGPAPSGGSGLVQSARPRRADVGWACALQG